jgi:hypothetical protein
LEIFDQVERNLLDLKTNLDSVSQSYNKIVLRKIYINQGSKHWVIRVAVMRRVTITIPITKQPRKKSTKTKQITPNTNMVTDGSKKEGGRAGGMEGRSLKESIGNYRKGGKKRCRLCEHTRTITNLRRWKNNQKRNNFLPSACQRS